MNNAIHIFVATVRNSSSALLKYRKILQLFLLISSAIGIAAVTNVSETGQQTSDIANDDGSIRAGVTWPSPRFTDNGDGTLTDQLSGLMWLKDGNCHGNRVEWIDALGLVDFLNDNPAFSNCTDYMATYSDWRLPNVNE